MNLTDFKSALDQYGIKYKESGSSLVMQECPACGSSKYKVFFYNTPRDGLFLGKCFRGKCEETYSSSKYLYMMGVPNHEIDKIHGHDSTHNINSLSPDFNDQPKDVVEEKEEIIVVDKDIDKFIKISAWPDHPASKYAVSRGVTKYWHDEILIDPASNSVVFLVKDGNRAIGYQKRFLTPPYEYMKTQTSYGFKKTEHIIRFKNKGSILVCEGPFTALSAWEFGFDGVCTMGSGISDEQINIIVNIAKSEGKQVGFATENDEAGIKSFHNFRNKMYWHGINVFEVYPEIGKDLNDSWKAGRGFILNKSDNWGGPGIPNINIFG